MRAKDALKLVKELRIVMELTQEQFAAKIGVTFSTVNCWENCKGTPSPLALQRIKELLNQIEDAEIKPRIQNREF